MKYGDGSIDALAQANPNALSADEFTDAYIGICSRANQDDVAAYDYDKCIDILIERGLTYDEAVDHFHYNTLGAWCGNGTPVFIETA